MSDIKIDNSNNTEKPKYFIKIWYKDRSDILREATFPFEKEKAFESIKMQVDCIMSEILVDDGGFWLNKNTIIPSNRVCEIQYFEDIGASTNSDVANNYKAEEQRYGKKRFRRGQYRSPNSNHLPQNNQPVSSVDGAK